MRSFTLHSRRWPLAALAILFSALASWAAGVWWVMKVSPESKVDFGVQQIRRAWSEKLSNAGPKTVFIGGSSTAFGIDTDYLTRNKGMPSLNWGMPAGAGAKVITCAALAELRAGDTAIFAFEPGTLTDTLQPTSQGIYLSYGLGHPEWVTRDQLGVPGLSDASALLALRPGARRAFSQLGKKVLGLPAFRYRVEDATESGFLTTAVRVPQPAEPQWPGTLKAESATMLDHVRAWCDAHQVRCAYALPWAFGSAAYEAEYRKRNAAFLLEVSRHLPVLKDPKLGAHTVAEDFADTAWHLTASGARLRTEGLAGQVQQWTVWTSEELEKQMQ